MTPVSWVTPDRLRWIRAADGEDERRRNGCTLRLTASEGTDVARAAGSAVATAWPAAPAHRHPLRAHLPAGPARHRRRRRHERLHRRGRQAAGRGSASRWRSSPGPPRSDLPPVVEMAPGVTVRHVTAGPFEGLAKEDLPGAAVRVHQRRAARRGGPPAGLLRPDPLALLAVRPGRLAGQGALGRAAGAHRAHPGQGQERSARRRRPARAEGPGDRRGAGGRRGRPAGRQHPVRGPASWSSCYDADPARVAVVAARRRPGPVPPRRRPRPGARARPAASAATSSRSSAGSSR